MSIPSSPLANAALSPIRTRCGRGAILSAAIGAAAPVIVSRDQLAFYSWLLQELLRLDAPDCVEISEGVLVPSFPLDEVCKAPSSLTDFFKPTDTMAERSPSLLLFHLFAIGDLPLPAALQLAWFNAIRAHALLMTEAEAIYPHIVVFCDVLPHDRDVVYRNVEDMVVKGLVEFLSYRGERRPAATIPQLRPNPDELRANWRRLQPAALKQLERRLTRARGHFRRSFSAEGDFCTSVLYDASGCLDDLSRVLLEAMRELGNLEPLMILYDTHISHWLDEAALLLRDAAQLRVPVVQLRDFLKAESRTDEHTVSSSLLLLPVIDTGETLRANLGQIWSLHGVLPAAVIAVIATRRFLDGLHKGSSPPMYEFPEGGASIPI